MLCIISLAACSSGADNAPAQPAQTPSEAAVAETVSPEPEKTTTVTETPTETAAEPTTLTFMAGDAAIMDWFNEYFPQFVSGDNEHNITVEAEFQQETTQILQVKAAADEIPELVSAGIPQELYDQGKFADLSGEAIWDTLYPAAKELTKDIKSGKNFTVPMSSSAVGIYYNKAIFNELGLKPAVTWADFVANLEQIKQAKPDIIPFYVGGKDSWMFGHMHEYGVMGVPKAELGYVEFERAAAENNLEKLKWNTNADGILASFGRDMMELKEKGLINENVVTATADNQVEAFATGKAATISNGTWALVDITKKNPNFTDIGFCAYPAYMEGAPAIVGNPFEGSIALSSKPEKLDASKVVLSYIFSQDALKSSSEYRGAIPSSPTVDADWSFLKDDISAVLAATASGTWTQNLPGGFSSDLNGRLVQNIFVDKYAAPEDYAQEYIDMWTEAWQAANG
jgi:raffinose/stachyose/melibiose transport system substrate-binding protein